MSWEKLGDEVRARRKVLKLTQADVTERGGPSVETVRAVENNRAGRLSRRSRRSLEQALKWEPSSIEAILNGGSPSPVRDGAGVAIATQDSAAGSRFMLAERLLEIRRTYTRHREEMSESAANALRMEVDLATHEVQDAIVRMLPWLGDEDRISAIRILTELQAS